MGQHCLRNIQLRETSPYWGGGFERYGRYQWRIKYYGFKSDDEIEYALLEFFGVYDYTTGSFPVIDALLGGVVKAGIDGRMGGWFYVDTYLCAADLHKLDIYICSVLEDKKVRI